MGRPVAHGSAVSEQKAGRRCREKGGSGDRVADHEAEPPLEDEVRWTSEAGWETR